MKCLKCNFENPSDTKFCGECAAPLYPSEKISASLTETLETPKEELTTGSTFAGRYQIIEELGKGGMGKVYKVLDKEINEKVALKLIKHEIAADEKTIERFRNELIMARKISHKNVCCMYHLSKEEGIHYISMEYVPGEDLKSSIRRMGPLSSGKSILIAKQVCEGLAEAHRLGVVHRDLKPQNIMIDREGNARIMDFGIARSLKSEGLTGTGVMIGTPEYMSPEQVEGKEADQRSDIYSLGIILYEMLTGRVPFEGDTPFSIALKHKTEEPPDARKVNAQIPEDLSRVILKCMEKNREKRYKGVEELLSEFTNIEKGIPTTERVIPERKPSTSREITVKLWLKKLLIPALVLLVLVIAAVIVLRFIAQSKFSATSLPPEITAEKEDYFMAGNKYWKSKNYPEAINQFRKILDMAPKNLEAQLSLADILKEQGKINEAIPEYEKVIALNNLDPRPYNQLGEIFEEKQELEKAVHYYRKYLNTTPKSPNFKIINQKIDDLEVQLHPLDEEEKQIVEPLEIEKVDLSTKLDLGIKAFNQGDFNQCIKKMEEILKLEPKNNTAQYFLAEAKKRKGEKLKEQEIRNRLKIAQDAYQKGDYKECINQTKRILRLDPDNAQSIKYSNLANLKIAPEQIKAIVSQFIKSINNKDLLAFYKKTCSSQLYQELKKDTELILNEYDNLASVSSNISIRFEGLDKAEVNFSNIMTGVSRKDGIKQVLFEGIFKWDMEKQGDNWKIIDISSTYAEKK